MKYQELLDQNKEELNYTDLLKCSEWKVKREEIKKRDNYKCQNCGTEASSGPLYSGSNKFYFRKMIDDEIMVDDHKIYLEVHHQFYIIGRLPWQYKSQDLISVCSNCHKEIHENEEISIYFSEDCTKVFYNSCGRCGGSGFLEQYSHVQGGICFRCRGIGSEIPV